MKVKRRFLWIGGVLVLVLVAGGVVVARARGGKDPEVQTSKVSRAKIVQTVNGLLRR